MGSSSLEEIEEVVRVLHAGAKNMDQTDGRIYQMLTIGIVTDS